MPSINNLSDLFHETLRDIYYAEKKLLNALPKLADQAVDDELADAFRAHLAETEGQVDRIERVFDLIGKSARGKKCPAIEGLVEESDEVIKEARNDAVLDAGLIATAQAVEHYEIARYGALIAWADELGETEIAELLGETLEQEKKADALLNEIASRVNASAVEVAEEKIRA